MTRLGPLLAMKCQAENQLLMALCLPLPQKEVEQMMRGIHLSMIETLHEIIGKETGRGSETQTGGTRTENGSETRQETRNVTAHLLLDEHLTICSITV